MIYPMRNPDVAARTVDGEAVIVSPDNATLHNLNEIGTVVWRMADGRTSLEAIAKSISDLYQISESEALADVGDFCRAMTQKELLALSDSPRNE